MSWRKKLYSREGAHDFFSLQILAGGCSNLIGTAVSLLPVVHPSSHQKSEYWTKYLEEKAADRKPRYDKSEFWTTYIEDKKRNDSGTFLFCLQILNFLNIFPFFQDKHISVKNLSHV